MTRNVNANGWTVDQGLAAQYAAQAGLDPDLAAGAGEKVWDVLKSLRDAAEETNPRRQAKLVKRTKVRLAKANLSRHGELVQHIEARLLAMQGRGGDTELAHLTPGEMIVPPQLQTPEVIQAIQQAAQNAGVDMAQYTAGSRGSSVNPETGLQEFSNYDLEQFDGGRNTPGQKDIYEFVFRDRYTPPVSGDIPFFNIDNSPGIFGSGGGGSSGGSGNGEGDGGSIEEIEVIGKKPTKPPPVDYNWINAELEAAKGEAPGLIPTDIFYNPCARGQQTECCNIPGTPIDPDSIGPLQFPTREQLRGLDGHVLEHTANKYGFGAGLLSTVSDTLPVGSVLKLFRGIFKNTDGIMEILTTGGVSVLRDTLLDIENAYRAHLATRDGC